MHANHFNPVSPVPKKEPGKQNIPESDNAECSI